MILRIMLLLAFFASVANAQNMGLKEDVNWGYIVKEPAVEEASIDVGLSNYSNNNDAAYQKGLQNEDDSSLIDLDFLNDDKEDDRVFKDFTASLRVLNKNTDNVKVYKINGISPIKIKGYNIIVESCAEVEIVGVQNEFAFLSVLKQDKTLFKGWVSNINKSMSYPELRDLYITLDSCKRVEQTY